MFEILENSNPIVIEDVHVFDFKKRNFFLILIWITSFKMFGL